MVRRRVRVLALLPVLAILACTSGPGSGPAHPPNVVLITLDTVRADRLGCYGGGVATPALDRLAREGVRFDQATSAAPLTLPSHATILSGLLPPRHGLRNNGGGAFPAETATLATRLAATGYRTGAFVGAFVLDHRFGLARGFETYDDAVDRGASVADALEAERPGNVVVDRALQWLGQVDRGRPYFLWVHLYDAHAPYAPPAPYRERYRDRAYDGEVAFVDAQVGRILQALDGRGEADHTVVAAVADHGESLGDHGEETHGLLLYQPTLRVPLLLRAPGIPKASVVEGAVSLVDLAPTLASLAGAPFPAGTRLEGRDLSEVLTDGSEPPREDVYSETEYPRLFGWSGMAALRRGGLKHIASPRQETFDLSSDPEEHADLGRTAASEELEAVLAQIQEGAAENGSAIDPETRAKLESLGYVGGAIPSGGGRDPKDVLSLFHRFERAHGALRAGTDEAATLVALVAEDPGNPVFLEELAQAERQRGNLPQAIASQQKAVALKPDDAGARYELALLLQEAGREDDARSALEEAIGRSPAFPEAHNALGITLAAGGRLPEALREFDRAVVLDPRDSRAHNNRGNALRDLGRLPEAEDAYRRALVLDPRYADAHTGLGAAALARDDAQGALAEFDRALALAPGQHEILVNRGIALELLGRASEAREAYRSFLAAAGDTPAYAPTRAATRQLLARLDQKEKP